MIIFITFIIICSISLFFISRQTDMKVFYSGLMEGN